MKCEHSQVSQFVHRSVGVRHLLCEDSSSVVSQPVKEGFSFWHLLSEKNFIKPKENLFHVRTRTFLTGHDAEEQEKTMVDHITPAVRV